MTPLEPVRTEPTPSHRACSQLQFTGLADDTVSRFIHGIDDVPRLMSPDEITAELQDLFAVRLLSAGVFPNTAGEVLTALEQADPGGPLSEQSFFLVGEGGQAPPGTAVARNLRFLITCGGTNQDGPDIVISSFHPDQGMVELVAWDQARGGFNYYRTMTDSNAWVFAGNSAHALSASTGGSGPFESHVNGHFLMKELKVPWVNWDSPFAKISASALADQGLQDHPWIARLEPGGAYALEDNGARPAIRRWNGVRVASIRSGISSETPARMLRQVVETLTVNLASSTTSSAAALSGSASSVDLPADFFVDGDMLEVLGLPTPPRFVVPADVYKTVVLDLQVRLTDGDAFDQPGETHFAFVVPERAHEDVDVVRQGTASGLLTRRLVACLAMVDFPNPVFSERRASLLPHINSVEWDGSGEAFAEAIAASVNAAAAGSSPAPAETEFAANWAIGDAFVEEFGSALTAYYSAIEERLSTVDGFRDFYLLAESRRREVRRMPIFESPLLFPTSAADGVRRRMTELATLEED